MLTKEEYDKFAIDTVFRSGITSNSPSGVYMVDTNLDRLLGWVAIKEQHGWNIYTHWVENGYEYIKRSGDKIIDRANICKLVPCTDEVYNLYNP